MKEISDNHAAGRSHHANLQRAGYMYGNQSSPFLTRLTDKGRTVKEQILGFCVICCIASVQRLYHTFYGKLNDRNRNLADRSYLQGCTVG